MDILCLGKGGFGVERDEDCFGNMILPFFALGWSDASGKERVKALEERD